MAGSVFDEQGRRKYLNREENRRFLEATRSLSVAHRTFCLVIYYTGCRPSEALNLTGKSIDAEAGTLVIKTLEKRRREEFRRVPIPPDLIRKLSKIAGPLSDRPNWEFCRSTGWHIIKRVMKSADIDGPQATAKGLRHGFGVRCAMNGIPVNKIRDWMGHSDSETTEIYLCIRDDEELELIKRTW